MHEMSDIKRKRLNEKELGSLYLLAETPLITDRLLKSNQYQETDITAFHESLSHHAPDMAMIAVSLSGNMIAEAMKKTGDEALIPLAAELKYLCVNTLEEVGRIWIDACRYGIENKQDIDDIVNQSSDILCMFASIFMEIAEICTPEPAIIRALCAGLMYQCEAHADSARAMVENANPQPNRTSIDLIPLPPELQNKTYSDNVVTFTLFGEKRI
jgi:hypothetical protein